MSLVPDVLEKGNLSAVHFWSGHVSVKKMYAKLALMSHTRNCNTGGIFLLSDLKTQFSLCWHSRKKAVFQLLFLLGVMICTCFHGFPRHSALSVFQCCFLALSINVHDSIEAKPVFYLFFQPFRGALSTLSLLLLHTHTAFVSWLLLFRLTVWF